MGVGENLAFVGRGYLISVDLPHAYKLRSPQAHGTLHPWSFNRMAIDENDPIASIRVAFDGDDAFCIHPQDFAFALERELRNRAIDSGATLHRCPVCGVQVYGGVYCPVHGRR